MALKSREKNMATTKKILKQNKVGFCMQQEYECLQQSVCMYKWAISIIVHGLAVHVILKVTQAESVYFYFKM
jgi:hypothetical protein